MERKFKVGERYSYNNARFGKGIIEIEAIRESIVTYKDIEGCLAHNHCFHADSSFAHDLEKLNYNETIVIYRKDNEIIALNKSTGEKAVAKCNSNDEFDFHVGAKLAFQRLIGETPDKNAMPDQEVKEVRRVARLGEYIKIVNAVRPSRNYDGTPVYKNGDVLKVKHVNIIGSVVLRSGKDINGHLYILAPQEYVVLENYKPDGSEKEIPSENQEMAKVLKESVTALEAEGFTHKEAVKFILAIASGKRG